MFLIVSYFVHIVFEDVEYPKGIIYDNREKRKWINLLELHQDESIKFVLDECQVIVFDSCQRMFEL